MQPATAQKKDDAALEKSVSFDPSLDTKKSSSGSDGGDAASGPKKSGPMSAGPQAKGEKGKVDKKGAAGFGKKLAKKASGGKGKAGCARCARRRLG